MGPQSLATLAAAVGVGYLIGSFHFAVLVEHWKHIDLRRYGSGNLGASNAYVVAGRFAGVFVLFGDGLKGLAAVLLVGIVTDGNHSAMAGAAVGAVLGHDWSLYLRLKGG